MGFQGSQLKTLGLRFAFGYSENICIPKTVLVALQPNTGLLNILTLSLTIAGLLLQTQSSTLLG